MEFNELLCVLKTVFPNTPHFDEKMEKKDIPDWDSINHLNLIIELEDAFNITFSVDEIQDMNSFEKILQLINQKNND
jgi:acyl carrier protein